MSARFDLLILLGLLVIEILELSDFSFIVFRLFAESLFKDSTSHGVHGKRCQNYADKKAEPVPKATHIPN